MNPSGLKLIPLDVRNGSQVCQKRWRVQNKLASSRPGLTDFEDFDKAPRLLRQGQKIPSLKTRKRATAGRAWQFAKRLDSGLLKLRKTFLEALF